MNGPHQGQRVSEAGAPLDRAKAAVLLVHGRGATAESILTLAEEFARPDVAYLAPQAAGNTWYPYSFLAPIEQNEPGLSSGLQALRDVLRRIEQAGIPAERTVVLGFSQGACLALEFTARHARRYGGAVALSGGLIGTGPSEGAAPPFDKRFDYEGSLDGTPVFLGCSDVDAHIPIERVHQSRDVLEALGGAVTERIYPGMGHTVNEDEVRFVRALLASLG
jgi:predicted esterase